MGSRAMGSQGVTVSFAEHYADSEQFEQLFAEGMSLVENTASYLDGPGRREAKSLSPGIALVYATESMRLTTRLLEIASWLILRRAVRDGEITEEEAHVKRRTIRLATIGRPTHVTAWDQLPGGLRKLIEASFSLNDRVVQIDRLLQSPARVQTAASGAAQNPIAVQHSLIEAVFGAERNRR